MRTTVFLVIVALALPFAAAAGIGRYEAAHETDVPELVVASTSAGGGALVVEHDFAAPILVTESTRIGGFVLYTATDPSFEVPASDDAEESLFRLDEGTPVTVAITERADGATVAMKLRGETLATAGDSVLLGTMPTLHAHPEWQLTLPEGEVGCQTIGFRLTTTAADYTASQEYEVRVANDLAACGDAHACGDADGNGTVTVTDGVVTLRSAAGLAGGCPHEAACDVDGNGAVTVTDGVNVLRAAAGLATTLACPEH